MTSTTDQIATAIAAGKLQQRARALGGPLTAGIEKAYREAVKTAHPDVGGDPAAFRVLTAARDQLVRRVNALQVAFAAVPGEAPVQKGKLN